MRDGSESQAAPAPGNAVRGLRFKGLGARLVLAQLLVARGSVSLVLGTERGTGVEKASRSR